MGCRAGRTTRLTSTCAHSTGAALVAAHPDRFGLFASLPVPDVSGAQAELRHALDDLGAEGVTLESHAHGVYLGDPRYAPLLEFMFDTARTVSDLLLSGAFARYPRIRWVVPHGGGVLPLLADRLDLFRRGFLGDGGDPRDAGEILAGLWFDTAGTPFPHQVPILTGLVGDGQVVYGSDSCWTPEPAVDRALTIFKGGLRPRGAQAGGLRRPACQSSSAPAVSGSAPKLRSWGRSRRHRVEPGLAGVAGGRLRDHGAAAMLGAAMQAPLTGLVLVLVLTCGGFGILVPVVAATVAATVVARQVGGYSICTARLRAG
jgi:Amidohydrolase